MKVKITSWSISWRMDTDNPQVTLDSTYVVSWLRHHRPFIKKVPWFWRMYLCALCFLLCICHRYRSGIVSFYFFLLFHLIPAGPVPSVSDAGAYVGGSDPRRSLAWLCWCFWKRKPLNPDSTRNVPTGASNPLPSNRGGMRCLPDQGLKFLGICHMPDSNLPYVHYLMKSSQSSQESRWPLCLL